MTDEQKSTATGGTVVVRGEDNQSVTLAEHKDTFSFKVPNDSPVESERGKSSDRDFTYGQAADEETAQLVAEIKGWTLLGFVNDALKAASRSNSYQAALAPHKPSKVSDEDIVERMVRDYIRLGIPEDIARKQVETMRAQVK